MKNKGIKEIKLSNPQVRPTIIQSVSLCSMNTTIPVELQFLNMDFFDIIQIGLQIKVSNFPHFCLAKGID